MKQMWFFILLSLSLNLSAMEYIAINYDHFIDKMPKIQKGLWETHFKLYQGYVAQVNLLNQLIKTKAGVSTFEFQSIKRQLGWEYNGMVLHQLYFENLGGDGNISPTSPIYKKIKTQWGSYENWMAEFKKTCNERGVGWSVLYYDRSRDSLYNAWIADHADGAFVGAIPLFVVDLWEHAYLCQFGTNRDQYVETIFEYAEWNVVNERWKNALCSVKAKEPRKGKPEQSTRAEKTGVKKCN